MQLLVSAIARPTGDGHRHRHNIMAPDKFVEQLNIAEAAADVTMREFMQDHPA